MRLYEGTNEINRLIIPTRMLRAPPSPLPPPPSTGPFALEHDIVARGTRIVRALLHDDLREEQEILGHLADIAIETYALESAILRTETFVAKRGMSEVVDVVRVYASDAADRMWHSARQVVAALGVTNADADALASRPPVDTVAARRRIADRVVGGGRYPW